MHIVIAGASGFVGNTLIMHFSRIKNFEVTALKRTEISDPKVLESLISNADVIINLSGASIAKRWNQGYKKILYDSRIKTTKALVSAVNKNNKEQLFISTSAIGIYHNNVKSDEKSPLREDGFLANLCKDWEEAAQNVNAYKRLVIFRYGVVLSNNGGALGKMFTLFRLGLGGNIGSGEQAFSFISMLDLIRAYDFIIEHPEHTGIFNLTTPFPTNNKKFSQILAKKLKRYAFFHLPSKVVELLFLEGASVLLEGQKVYPNKLLENGFNFELASIEDVIDYYI